MCKNCEPDKHQELMDEAYIGVWQKPENKGKSFIDFIYLISPIHRMAVVLGKLNQQVVNGGWEQWVSNGYCLSYVQCMDALNTLGTPTAIKTLEILKEVGKYLSDDAKIGEDNHAMDYWDLESDEMTCYNCGGEGCFLGTDDDENSDEETDCEVCNGTGHLNPSDGYCPNLDKQNQEFLKISDAFLKDCNDYFLKNAK